MTHARDTHYVIFRQTVSIVLPPIKKIVFFGWQKIM